MDQKFDSDQNSDKKFEIFAVRKASICNCLSLYVHIRETGVTADITIDGLTIKNLATFETKTVHLDVVGLSLELELDVPLLRVSFFAFFNCIMYNKVLVNSKKNSNCNLKSFESMYSDLPKNHAANFIPMIGIKFAA